MTALVDDGESDGAELGARLAALRDEVRAATGTREEPRLRAELAAALVDHHESRDDPDTDEAISGLSEAIGHAEHLLADGRGDAGLARFLAGLAYYYRFSERENPDDLDATVSHLVALTSGPGACADPDGDEDDLLHDALALLAQALMVRCQLAPDSGADLDADLREAIRLKVLCYLRPDDDEASRAETALDIGMLRYQRFQHLAAAGHGGLDDLNEAVTYFRRASEDGMADPPVAAEATVQLGQALWSRVLRGAGSPADVTEAIAVLSRAHQCRDADDAIGALVALYLGVMLGVRYAMYDGSPADRQAGIGALRHALRHPDVQAERDLADLARMRLGMLLMMPIPPQRFGRDIRAIELNNAMLAQLNEVIASDHVQADTQEAVRCLSQVSDEALQDRETASAVAALLGSAMLAQGARGMSASDLDQVIDCLARASRLTTPGSEGAAEIAAMHAWILAERAGRPGHESDIDPAAAALQQALDQLGDDDNHPLRPIVLHHLGLMLGRRGMRRLAPADLAAGINALTDALELMGPEHPMRPETLGLLAAALMSGAQFDVSGLPFDRIVSLLAELRQHPHPDAAKQAAYLCCYGQALHFQAIRDRAQDGFARAADMVKEAAAGIPRDHSLRTYLLLTLASMLADQYDYIGDLEALDAAIFYLDEVSGVLEAANAPAYDPEKVDLYSVLALRGHARMRRAHRADDAPLLDAAIADLEFALGVLPRDHPMRPRVSSDLSTARLGKAALAQDMAGVMDAWPRIVEAAESLPADHVDKAAMTGRGGMMCITQGVLTRDLALLGKGITLLKQAAGRPGLLASERSRFRWGVGLGLLTRYEVSGAAADINAAIDQLEGARQDLASEPGSPVAAFTLAELARAYHVRAGPDRRDARRAVETGIAALREQAGDVLLQTSTERALTMARMAAADAGEIAVWARADGQPQSAVEALELGRGLVLHAATMAVDLPELLREAGHAKLATEWADRGSAPDGAASTPGLPWEHLAPGSADGGRMARTVAAMTADLPGLAVPDSLRHRVLTVLASSNLDRALLSPPRTEQIAAAMQATGIDAVAYLMAAGDHGDGFMVIVRPDGSARDLALPRLDTSPGSPARSYANAHHDCLRAELDDPHSQAARRARYRWTRALAGLCDWAWAAAVKPLLDSTARPAGEQPPHLLLIPFGLLGMVPWHAARGTDSSGRTRRACEQAVFSYAASARQLVDAASRDTVSAAAGQVLVADPVERDYWASREADFIRAAYYRHACLLSARAPRATPASVLASLPGGQNPSGAALLHLSCHAQTAPSSADSHLRLRADQPLLVEQSLSVEQILRQAHRKPPRTPGGLVVLSACVSDLSTSDYDEALTLATAFLTAGAVSVVGTRWQVPDVRTAILMFMFHHHLNTGQQPADALRSAQLWMLNPDRATPAEMPHMLAEEVPLSDLSDPVAWAGFTHQGK